MTVTVMVSLPEEFLEEVDRVAQEEHRTRSEMLREALRLYVRLGRKHGQPGDLPRVQRAVAAQNAIAQAAPGLGEDSTLEVRRWREAR